MRAYLDTNVLIYAFERYKSLLPSLQLLMNRVRSGELIPMTSFITLSEILVMPYKTANEFLRYKYQRIFLSENEFKPIPVSYDILCLAAELRANYSLKLILYM